MEIDGIAEQAFKEYEEVRIGGACNMFDRNCVLEQATFLGLTHLVDAIEDGLYGKILMNYGKAVEAGIIVEK